MTSTPPSPAPLQYGPPISLERAKQVMKAAEAEAARNFWPMVIAIVDSGGHLVLLERMDNAQYGSILIAQQKAETALNFKRATKVFEEALERGGANLRLLGATNLLPLEGGLVLIADGKIVGALGVSGMQSGQDVQVAMAGADVM
jgi:glc operon protein GlcG